MSDSSEDEDLSRFKEAVDISFLQLIEESRGKSKVSETPPQSQRYLDESTHYNDVKVPEEMQKKIGAKISAIIKKNVEFVDVPNIKVKKRKIKGGVKLFSGSEGFLSCEEAKDVYTKIHNRESKKLLNNLKKKCVENDEMTESDKIQSAVVTGEYVLSKEETKSWKSRRKEKLYKYKTCSAKSKLLISVE